MIKDLNTFAQVDVDCSTIDKNYQNQRGHGIWKMKKYFLKKSISKIIEITEFLISNEVVFIAIYFAFYKKER